MNYGQFGADSLWDFGFMAQIVAGSLWMWVDVLGGAWLSKVALVSGGSCGDEWRSKLHYNGVVNK